MSSSIEDKVIIFTHKNQRGNFEIKILEEEIKERPIYKDIQIIFSVKIENKDDSSWKVIIDNHPAGYIDHIADREKLIEKLKDEIKDVINTDEQGEFYISDPFLDLSSRQNKK